MKLNSSVLIACPIRDREWILPYYLDHLYKLDYPKDQIGLLWILNQSSDASFDVLRTFQREHQHEYKNIRIISHFGSHKLPKDIRTYDVREKFIYHHLADIRNLILEHAKCYDYLFSLDSDVLIKPSTLKQLISHNKDIVSSLIYNGYNISSATPWKYPNILKILSDGTIEHIANVSVKNAPFAISSNLLKVDITGAAMLISQKVTNKAKYSFHKQGEDIPFCLDCKKHGFEIWSDAGCFNSHIMNKDMLQHYLDMGENNEKENYTISTDP